MYKTYYNTYFFTKYLIIKISNKNRIVTENLKRLARRLSAFAWSYVKVIKSLKRIKKVDESLVDLSGRWIRTLLSRIKEYHCTFVPQKNRKVIRSWIPGDSTWFENWNVTSSINDSHTIALKFLMYLSLSAISPSMYGLYLEYDSLVTEQYRCSWDSTKICSFSNFRIPAWRSFRSNSKSW